MDSESFRQIDKGGKGVFLFNLGVMWKKALFDLIVKIFEYLVYKIKIMGEKDMDTILSIEILEKKENNNKKEFNVGDIIKIKAVLKDDKSGVKASLVSFKNPSRSRSQDILLKSGDGNIWEGEYIVKSTDEGGLYNDFRVFITDNAGNSVSISDLSSYIEKMKFTINNDNGDIKAPEIKQIKLNNKKNN